jgi:uncharacterized protein
MKTKVKSNGHIKKEKVLLPKGVANYVNRGKHEARILQLRKTQKDLESAFDQKQISELQYNQATRVLQADMGRITDTGDDPRKALVPELMNRMDHVRGLVANQGTSEQLIQNEFTMLRGWFWKNFLDPAGRDIDRECGYPPFITIEQMRQMYDREGIGTRVVDVWPDESWKNNPEVYELEEEDTETEFEVEWNKLQKKFNIYSFLHRIDKMSGIGYYGLLLYGLNDGRRLHEPVKGMGEDGSPVGKNIKNELTYLRCFDESQCMVSTYQMDTSNPRFGQPTSYLVKFYDPRTEAIPGALSIIQSSVHWSRVIHIADNRTTSEVFGIPRMRPVWNRLLDLRKLCGGSPEMFWKGAFPGYSFEVDPKLADIEMDTGKIRQEFYNFENSLQRYLAVQGLHVNQLSPQVSSPKDHFDMLITCLCIQLGTPKRILMGSEQGELASGQDKGNWNGRVEGRQHRYVTPYVIRPFIDRMMAIGVLPYPMKKQVNQNAMSGVSALGLEKQRQEQRQDDQAEQQAEQQKDMQQQKFDQAKKTTKAGPSKNEVLVDNLDGVGISPLDTGRQDQPKMAGGNGLLKEGNDPKNPNQVGEYHVDWPDLNIPSDADKAAVCLQRTQALVQFTMSDARMVVTEKDYLQKYQGFTSKEATAMVEAALKTVVAGMDDEDVKNLPKIPSGASKTSTAVSSTETPQRGQGVQSIGAPSMGGGANEPGVAEFGGG